MRSQFKVAVLLGTVAASAADAADLANGGGYETVCFTHRAGDYLRLRAGRDRAMLLVSALAKSALFPAHGQASEGRSS